MKRFLLPIALLLSACGPSSPGGDSSGANAGSGEAPVAEAPDEDQVLLQLSAYLIGEPESQAEEDQNAIINYAIEKAIPLQRSRSGLFYRILEEGQGEQLEWGDYVSAHYKGYFLNGRVFDSSYRREKPIQFYIGNMVDGWNEGLQLIRPGGKILLLIPSHLAYGEEGFPDGKEGFIVSPNTPLAFEVEVLEKLKDAKEAQ